MNSHLSYTTEEIAKMLKISKLTVYDLIKKGKLQAYRVGRQMRVDAEDLDAYKAKAKSGGSAVELQSVSPPADEPEEDASGAAAYTSRAAALSDSKRVPHPYPHTAAMSGTVRTIVITGQDVSLDILAKHIESRSKSFRPLRAFAGSMDSLIAMYKGDADIVSTHLLDGDTGEYNIPYIRKLLTGHSYTVVNMLSRTAGFYVQKGNPKELRGWGDLGKSGIRIANREKGSGARVLLDEMLRAQKLKGKHIAGYSDEWTSHMGVAGTVAAGDADVGIGIEKAAYLVGAEFIPLVQERYDLVMINTPNNGELIETICGILRSEPFRKELASIRGYDLSRTGEVIYEC
ncbi:helix-turn-helix transcriptional regulator [Paenibacillus contaminans]|uniref:Excisionase n=1 Tax=Paenibacillus contaminans TaxID=450362 RepID=A0A329LP16_9BACL|nr:helix-turn-helix transcriptional regulator [Paenibacillus contaminans]RAV08463.1 hypothetical protein DQG23_41015 [Paenibacillus contaminans]